MKKLFLMLIMLSSSFLFSQQNTVYSPNSVVIPPPNYHPTGTNSTVYTSADGFDNFYLGSDFGETNIAVNPTDPKNQVCAYNMNSFYYTLNGIDWIRGYPLFSGFPTAGDPVVAFDGLGNVYYAQMYTNPSGNVIGNAVAKSTNKGVSWYSYVSAFVSSSNDKPWIIADQTGGPYANNIYVAQWQAGTFNMMLTRSTNGGLSYASPISLTGSQGAYISVGPNGATQGGYVYFACTYVNSISFYRSGDGGASYTSIGYAVSGITGPGSLYNGRYTVKSAHIRTDFFPRMAVDNSYSTNRGNIYITYAANPVGPDLADIFLVRSTNYGSTWSTPIRVNDDATTCDQWMPCINTDKSTGKVFISWYDSRNDPANNLMTELYGTTSTDGGLTFAPNSKIANANFNPNTMAEPQSAGDAYYIGDYIGVSSTGNGVTGINSWMDDRVNTQYTMQSFVGYNPDFAFITNPAQKLIGNNDSTTVALVVPAVKGIYSDRVKFTASLDTLPSTGTINFTFVNGKDTITTYPDSVYLKIKTIGTVTPAKIYRISIYGAGSNGTPVHRRIFNLVVNSQFVNIQSNRNGICNYIVNGITYNSPQQLIFPTGTSVNVAAISPQGSGGTRYIFKNWSDNGDTSHNIVVSGPLSLTVFYKPQYILILNSDYGTTVGGGQFYDSAASFTFGVYPRIVYNSGQYYRFRGWDGAGNGSYTSTDSTGLDSMKTISMANPIVETARWTLYTVGIHNISTELPDRYNLYQNYPNPFNPSTTINFDVVSSGLVKITIYDALGRELNTIVNDYLSPGKYKTVFNADKFASGIYFYKITVNDFSNIKKMLLLK